MRTLTARLLRRFLYGQDFTCIVNGVVYNNEETRDLLKGIENQNQEIDFQETGTLQLTFNL